CSTRSSNPENDAPSRLLPERISRGLVMDQVVVAQRDGFAVFSDCHAKHVDSLAVAEIRFFDGPRIDFLQYNRGLAGISSDGICLAVEPGVIALAGPAHLESMGAHLVVDGDVCEIHIETLLLPGARYRMGAR